ncbi:MAG: glycosyltransferase family 2 protein [Candidatus Diapherotrites archaeon]
MKASIIIPSYNEGGTIGETIGAVKRVSLAGLGLEKEIIVVDDGSTDNSAETLGKIKGIKLVKHEKNRGKGAAIRTGIANSKGEIIIIQDADLEYDPKFIPKLLEPIVKGRANVVYGSRALGKVRGKEIALHRMGNQLLSAVTAIIYGTRITDMETGYKAFRREVLAGMRLRSNAFDFEPEITAKILKKGEKIIEVPIDFRPRGFAEGKKIRWWKDGFCALWALLKYRVSD